MLGLHCCADFPLVEASRGYSLVAVHGPLIAVASLVEHRLQVTEFSTWLRSWRLLGFRAQAE